MTELCQLATKYGTDKAELYTPVYDLLLSGRRQQVQTVLEIGIGTVEAMKHVPGYQPGASLRMWREYFPNALVWGADIFPSDDVGALQLDQGNAAQLVQVGEKYGPFDLIIDDGSHDPHHQVLGLQTLSPYLTEDGLYIIEDVNNFDELVQKIPMDSLCISYPSPYKHAARCMVIRAQH